MTETLAPEEAGRRLVQAGAAEQRHLAFDAIEVRDDGDKIIFDGHAAVFDRLSEDLGGFRERIQRGAFRKVLDAGADIRLLFNHNADLVMARSTINKGPGMLDVREDPKGLRTYAELVPTQTAKDLRALVSAGVVTQQSFSFRIGAEGRDVWEETDGELIRTIVSFGEVFDVGPVVFPAYPQTDAGMRARVCGTEVFTEDGDVREEQLRALAMKIHRGEHEASVEDRAVIDAAFARIDSVSPWWLELSHRASSQEPEWVAAVTATGDTGQEDAESGGPVAYRLAARKRRLRAHAPTSKETNR